MIASSRPAARSPRARSRSRARSIENGGVHSSRSTPGGGMFMIPLAVAIVPAASWSSVARTAMRSARGDAVDLGEPVRQDLPVDAEADRPRATGPLQLPERAPGDEPPVIDDRERFAEGFGDLHLMGREHDRAARVAQLDESITEQ